MVWPRSERKNTAGSGRGADDGLYQILFEHSLDGVLIVDAATMLPLEFNDVACRQLGYSRREFRHIPISKYEASVSGPEAEAHIRRALEQDGDGFDTVHRTKDGEARQVRVIAQPIEHQGRRAFLCIYRDITGRKIEEKRLEQAIDDSSSRRAETEALLSASRAVLEFQEFEQAARAIFDACKNLIGATSGYIALLSADGSENEVLFLDSGGLPCSVDEALPMPIRGLRGEAQRTGEAVYENDFAGSDWAGLMPEGHVDLENVLFAPLLIKNETVGLLGIANKPGGFTGNDARLATAFGDLVAAALYNDRTYESLEQSEERFRNFVEQSSEGIVIIDGRGLVIEWNEGQEKITGIRRREALGKPLWDLQFELSIESKRTPEARARLEKMFREFLQTRKPFWPQGPIENEIQRLDGTRRFIQTTTFPFRTSGDFLAASIARDITRRKQTEELSLALNDINAAITSTLELGDIMEHVVREAVTALECDSSAIFLREGERWRLGAHMGLPDVAAGELFEDDEAPAMVVAAREKRPIFVGDTSSEDHTGSARQDVSVRSFLAVPLISRQEAIGVVTFNRHGFAGSFNGEQVDFATKLAASVSMAIENANLYSLEQENLAKIKSHAAQLSMLHEIGLSFNRETDKHRLLKLILRGAAEMTLAGVGAMILIHEGKTELVSMYYAPWYDPRCEIIDDATTLHRNIARLIGADREVRCIGRLEFDGLGLSFPEGHPHLRGLLIGNLSDTRGATIGHFLLSNKGGGEDFTAADEEIMSLLAAQSSVALISAENFEQEHNVAETLQSALLPPVPRRKDVEVGLLYRSAGSYGKVGGDFYDFMELDGGRMAIAVGDVCGKGLKAATYTAMIKYMLMAYLEEGIDPGECLTRLNRAVHKQVSIDRFVTLSLALLDPASGTLTYASAGHPPSIVCRAGRSYPLQIQAAVPLGVLPDYSYKALEEPVDRDTSILMFTDGMIEARPANGTVFGIERLASEFTQANKFTAQKIADSLAQAALDYSGGTLRDDIALLVVKLLPAG